MYNYRRFRAEDYDFDRDVGVPVGERLDFEARTLDGRVVRLRDLRGQPVVLETGSLTCPMYAAKVRRWQRVADDHPEARFLLLYVREAHPGARTDAHQNWEDKQRAARRLHSEWGEWRDVWVDDLEGSVHERLGLLPVLMYVLDADGRIVMRASWSDPAAAHEALDALRRGDPAANIKLRDPMPRPPTALRALLKGGVRAVCDFTIAMPRLIPKRVRYRRRLRKGASP